MPSTLITQIGPDEKTQGIPEAVDPDVNEPSQISGSNTTSHNSSSHW